jgi:hypothetical protein
MLNVRESVSLWFAMAGVKRLEFSAYQAAATSIESSTYRSAEFFHHTGSRGHPHHSFVAGILRNVLGRGGREPSVLLRLEVTESPNSMRERFRSRDLGFGNTSSLLGAQIVDSESQKQQQ